MMYNLSLQKVILKSHNLHCLRVKHLKIGLCRLLLFYLSFYVNVDELLLAWIQSGQKLILENFFAIESRRNKNSKDFYEAENTAFAYIRICMVDY
jgi:hypothetical protein